MRVLLTGGAGYIGSVLVPILLEGGHVVSVLDTREPPEGSPGLCAIRGDIRDAASLEQGMRGADAVVHLAALSGRPACDRDPGEATSVNVEGTRAVAACSGARPLLLASTGSVYGAVPSGLCTEETPTAPLSHYGRTKRAAERLVLACPNGIVLRFATCYGLSPRLRLDLLVNHFVDEAIRVGAVDVYEPDARRTLLHVTDAARAILLVLEGARHDDRVLNVADESQNRTKREILELIKGMLPGLQVRYGAEGRDPDRRDYAVSAARIRELGFRARVGLEQGIRELLGELSRRRPPS